MEFRVLRYFLAVTREQSISAAANALHLSQPTLSRQLKDLEDELGKQLFLRSNRKITLTEEGLLLKKRAEEIMALMQKTQQEIALADDLLSGDIYIGAGETEEIRWLIKIMQQMRKAFPKVRFHILSGDKSSVLEELEHGLIDFALVFGALDHTRYDSISLPSADCFGVMMKKEDPLAKKDVLFPKDLLDQPLIVSRQILRDHDLPALLGCEEQQLHIVGSYNLLFNGSLMVEEGLGYAICLDHIINTTGKSPLCFRPLSTDVRPTLRLAWKKYPLFTKAAEKFLLAVQNDATVSKGNGK